MGNCTVQYGRDPSYQDLGPTIAGPLNSSFTLPLMESSTLYYIQTTFMFNSQPVTLRRNYTTGYGNVLDLNITSYINFVSADPHFTPTTLSLLVLTISFILAAVGIEVAAVVIAVYWKIRHCKFAKVALMCVI